MGEPADDVFLRLSPELVDEILLRLPPDEPACLVRASAVCKPWRRFFASANFRGRYREFHGAPPVLGLVQEGASFLAIPALPTLPDLSPLAAAALKALDCRHGRYVFDSYDQYWQGDTVHLTVLDPLTGHGRRIPTPIDNRLLWYSVAVLCAAQGCDHHDCHGGHFRVVILTTNHEQRVTLGWLYSSETDLWTALTSVSHPNVTKYSYISGSPSILVGDTVYFHLDGIIKCELGSRRLSMLERPADGTGYLMTAEDGGLGFATMVDVTNLTLWSMQTAPEGAMGWAKVRIIDLTQLLLDGGLSITSAEDGICGVAEGAQIIFFSTRLGTYRIDLKSRGAKIVSGPSSKVFPYQKFYIPVMEAASMDQGHLVGA